MPEHVPPRTNQSRLIFLQDACRQDRHAGILPADVSDELKACLSLFYGLFFRKIDMEAERMRLCHERKRAFSYLNMLIRHYWQAFRSSVRHGRLPVEAWQYIGLNQSGRNRRLVRMSEKLTAARYLVNGAEKLESDGWPVPEQPSAKEVAEAMQQATALTTAYDSHVVCLQELEATLKSAAKRVDRIYHLVFHHIRIELKPRGKATTRRMMRNHGIVFRYRADRDRVDRQAVLKEETFEHDIAPQVAPAEETVSTDASTREASPDSLPSLNHEERVALRRCERQILRRFHRKDPRRRRARQRKKPAWPPVTHRKDPTGAMQYAHAS